MRRTKRIKQALIKDAKRRYQFHKFETYSLALKAIISNKILPLDTRLKAQNLLNNLPLDSRISRIRNRCLITGRGRGVLPHWNISRYKFKELADTGQLPGVKKASF